MTEEQNNSQFIGQANQFHTQINNTIKTQFFSALDDFKKYYVYHYKNPEVNEFQNYYATSKGQLQSLSTNLSGLTKAINQHILGLDNHLSTLATQLQKEKQLYHKISGLASDLTATQNGSELLIHDSKTNYNNQYYSNWELILGIMASGIFLGTMFRHVAPKVPTALLPKK
jgi:hypothetical protein